MANQREHSKQNWASTGRIEEINAGSLQRIAAATEILAQNYVALQEERDRYRRYYEEELESKWKANRRIAALQGVITRMKNKANGGWKPVPKK